MCFMKDWEKGGREGGGGGGGRGVGGVRGRSGAKHGESLVTFD